jgi:hypothetical protein
MKCSNAVFLLEDMRPPRAVEAPDLCRGGGGAITFVPRPLYPLYPLNRGLLVPTYFGKDKNPFPAGNRIPDRPNSRGTLLNVDKMKNVWNIVDGPRANTAAEHVGG